MRTLGSVSRHEEVVKGSRFIAVAGRVDSEDDVDAFMGEHTEGAATHNCWAWRIGDIYRSTDDGEPGGTAGRPILAAIDGHDLDHVAVLVIRYYGGTNLGTGGLVRAYGGTASKCLDIADIIEELPTRKLTISADFPHTDAIRTVVAAHGGSILSENYSPNGVILEATIPIASTSSFRSSLRNATAGKAAIERH